MPKQVSKYDTDQVKHLSNIAQLTKQLIRIANTALSYLLDIVYVDVFCSRVIGPHCLLDLQRSLKD